MITLIRNGNVYDPEPLGEKDILVAGGKVAAVEKIQHLLQGNGQHLLQRQRL